VEAEIGDIAHMINVCTKTYTWRQIVWAQDSHGQWSSGDLKINPFIQADGKVVWKIWLDGEIIGRQGGYWSPRDAKRAAPICTKVKAVVRLEKP
jgi:hypothetical protein